MLTKQQHHGYRCFYRVKNITIHIFWNLRNKWRKPSLTSHCRKYTLTFFLHIHIIWFVCTYTKGSTKLNKNSCYHCRFLEEIVLSLAALLHTIIVLLKSSAHSCPWSIKLLAATQTPWCSEIDGETAFI